MAPKKTARRPAASRKASKAAPPAKARARSLPKAPPSPMFGISRIDYKATHGWFVRLGWHTTRQGKRPRFVGFFPDLRLGGKKKALAAAQAWQQQIFRTGRAPKIK